MRKIHTRYVKTDGYIPSPEMYVGMPRYPEINIGDIILIKEYKSFLFFKIPTGRETLIYVETISSEGYPHIYLNDVIVKGKNLLYDDFDWNELEKF